MDKIKQIKEWIMAHPMEVTTVLAAASVSAQVGYCVYSIVLDHGRRTDVRRYRKAIERAVDSGTDVKVFPNGTTEFIVKKK